MENKRWTVLVGFAGVVFAFLAAGCASTPSINVSDQTKATFDGLYPVDGSRVGRAWARAEST
mgnify:FL=1